jgi:hypothetical protein
LTSEAPTVPASAAPLPLSLSGTPLHPNWQLPAHLRQPRFEWLEEAGRSVRIHADLDADRLARSHRADAITLGRHIFFRAGKLDLGTSHGTALLAHELTHVAQHDRFARGSEEQFEREALGVERDVHRTLATRAIAPTPWPAPSALPAPLALHYAERTAREVPAARADNRGAAASEVTTAPTPMKASEARAVASDDAAGPRATTSDMHELAEHVYRLFERKLQIDRERLGLRRG